MANIQKLFLAILAVTLLVSCSPRVIERVNKQTDTLYYTKYQRDSIYLRDSVSVSMKAVGDTIYIDRYKSVIRYKERLKTDTLRQVKEIVKTEEKVVEVKKKNNWFSSFIYGLLCGGFLLLILQCRNSKLK